MVSNPLGQERLSVSDRFDNLLSDIAYRSQHYPYGNVDKQLSTIKYNLSLLEKDPSRLEAYKRGLLPHLEQLDYQLKRLVA